jgi:hypothetical protein
MIDLSLIGNILLSASLIVSGTLFIFYHEVFLFPYLKYLILNFLFLIFHYFRWRMEKLRPEILRWLLLVLFFSICLMLCLVDLK